QLLGRELAQGVEEMALPSRERVARQDRARHDRDGIAEWLLQEPAQRRHQPVGEGVEAAQPREAEESRNEDYEVGRQHPELIVVPVMLVPALVPTVVMVVVVVDVMDPEEHTSELQSRFDLVCRLLLEKKKNTEETPLAND